MTTPTTEKRIFTVSFTVGALLRRQMRAQFDLAGVKWTEYKGLFDSEFVVRGDAWQLTALRELVERVNAA